MGETLNNRVKLAGMRLEDQVEQCYGISDATYQNLNMPTNDMIVVRAQDRKYALKLYNVQSRGVRDVQWEVELVNHLLSHNAPVVRPIRGKHGYVESFIINGQKRAAVLFEWAEGEKPKPSSETYAMIGKAAAQIHLAADSFHSDLPRTSYGAAVLIDDQLERMKGHLVAANRWQQMVEMCDRLRRLLSNRKLDWGVCHMDLTIDNVHLDEGKLAVFDFDSSAKCWRALEPYKVLRQSRDYFDAWLRGYRSIRPFSQLDEQAVAAFGIIGDLRVVAWDLGVARSSRGEPRLKTSDVPGIVDGWLDWEAANIAR